MTSYCHPCRMSKDSKYLKRILFLVSTISKKNLWIAILYLVFLIKSFVLLNTLNIIITQTNILQIKKITKHVNINVTFFENTKRVCYFGYF